MGHNITSLRRHLLTLQRSAADRRWTCGCPFALAVGLAGTTFPLVTEVIPVQVYEAYVYSMYSIHFGDVTCCIAGNSKEAVNSAQDPSMFNCLLCFSNNIFGLPKCSFLSYLSYHSSRCYFGMTAVPVCFLLKLD